MAYFGDDTEKRNEIEKACEACDDFIKRQMDFLASFTGNQRLIYVADKNSERFRLDVKSNSLYIPVVEFVDRDYDENIIMWSIYRELALFWDWQKNADLYLARDRYFQNEIINMVMYIEEKVEKSGLSEDPAYSLDKIKIYVRREILKFLNELDRFYAYYRVQALCPLYRQEEERQKIYGILEDEGYRSGRTENLMRYMIFARMFMTYEIESDDKRGYFSERKEYRDAKKGFESIFIGDRLGNVYKDKVKDIILEREGIEKRDRLTKNTVLPVFIKLWKADIDDMELEKSVGKTEKEAYKSIFDSDSSYNIEDAIGMDENEKENIIKELADKNQRIQAVTEDIIKGKLDFSMYGVDDSDQKTFYEYEMRVMKERNKMKNFWKKLIGDAKKEVGVRTENQLMGKLNVNSLIERYPDFVESERRGSYKNLYIFDRYLLRPVAGILPEKIDVSFVIDNSGSMNYKKVDEARKALTAAMLSLDDFGEYLRKNAEYLHQKIDLRTETWLFGSGYYKVLSKEDNTDSEKKKAAEILSVSRLRGSDGSTDDGSCLKEISESIKPGELAEIRNGKLVRIVLEITDGASSFPSMAKEAVTSLIKKDVMVYAIEIGQRDEMTEKIFRYIWDEGYKNPHGIFLGEDTGRLTDELLKVIGNSMDKAMKSRR